MKDLSELFWSSPLESLKRGYADEGTGGLTCLICGRNYSPDEVFPLEGRYFTAQEAMRRHIAQEHGSAFQFLLGLDKKFTGLTELQKQLLTLFREGLGAKEIAAQLGGGSASTVRNHRFALRERGRQSKIFLAILELAEEGAEGLPKVLQIPKTAKMVDERFDITEEENEAYLKKYFPEGLEGPLLKFPLKEKRKVIVLRQIFQRFEVGREYTEKEVNVLLKAVYPDYVILRRYLIEYGFLDRTRDGSRYWAKV